MSAPEELQSAVGSVERGLVDSPPTNRLPLIDGVPHYPLLERVNARYIPEDNLFEARVPLEVIYRGDVQVDSVHVARLKRLIIEEAKVSGGTGQQVPLLLAVLPDFEQLPILNGFHRDRALLELGRDTASVRIRPTETWEQVTDQRIKNAGEHKSVEFARIIDWVTELFGQTPWAGRIKISQAFAFSAFATMSGKYLGLTEQEVDDLKQWTDSKCEEWGLGTSSIMEFFKTAEVAAPDLIVETRRRAGGHKLEALTPDHLKVVARALPNKYEIQRAVADVAKAQTLTVVQTRMFVEAVLHATTVAEVREAAASDAWKAGIRFVSKKTSQISSGVIFEDQPKEGYEGRFAGLRTHIEALYKLGFAETIKQAEDIVLASLDLLDDVHIHHRKKGETEFFEGDDTSGLVILREGVAILSNVDANSDRRAGYLVDGFAVIGGDILSGSEIFANSARTFTACRIQKIPLRTLQSLIRSDPRLGSFLQIEQSMRDRERNGHLKEWALKPIPERVAGALVDYASRADSLPDHISFSQELLALLAGCTRESVNKTLADFATRELAFWDSISLGPQLLDLRRLQFLRDGKYGLLNSHSAM